MGERRGGADEEGDQNGSAKTGHKTEGETPRRRLPSRLPKSTRHVIDNSKSILAP